MNTPPSTPMKPLAVKAPEAARLVGLGRSCLLNYAYAGIIPSVKVGRNRLFLVEDLERWVRDQATRDLGPAA